MLRECVYGEYAHEQHVRRTLTLTLTHTITTYSVSGNVVRVRILIFQLDKSRVEKEFTALIKLAEAFIGSPAPAGSGAYTEFLSNGPAWRPVWLT